MKKAYLNTLKREIKKLARRRLILAVMFIVPVLTSFMICVTFKEGSPRNLPIAVYDADKTEYSRLFIRMIDSTPSAQVDFYVNDLKSGHDLIVEKKAYALIHIPKDFQKDLLRKEQPKIVYYYNNQTLLVGGMITKEISSATQYFSAGITKNIYMKQGLNNEFSVSKINLIPVDEHIHSNPYINYSYFLSLASFAHVLQILITFIAIWAMGVEFKEGTTKQWVSTADNSILIALAGKLTPYFLSFLLVIGLVYFMNFVIYQAPFYGDLLASLIATFAFIFAYQMIAIAYVAITTNLRLALSAGSFYTAMGMAFAGLTFPVFSMPLIAKLYSDLLPLTYYIKIMVDQAVRGLSPIYDIKPFLGMLALACVGIAFIPMLKRRCYDEACWYKD